MPKLSLLSIGAYFLYFKLTNISVTIVFLLDPQSNIQFQIFLPYSQMQECQRQWTLRDQAVQPPYITNKETEIQKDQMTSSSDPEENSQDLDIAWIHTLLVCIKEKHNDCR